MYAIAGDAPNLKFEYYLSNSNLLSESGRNWSRYYNFGTLAAMETLSISQHAQQPVQ